MFWVQELAPSKADADISEDNNSQVKASPPTKHKKQPQYYKDGANEKQLQGSALVSRVKYWSDVCLFRQVQTAETLLCDYRWNYECTAICLVARRWTKMQKYLTNLCMATRASSQIAVMGARPDADQPGGIVLPKEMPQKVIWVMSVILGAYCCYFGTNI